jgi:hypothetical protein
MLSCRALFFPANISGQSFNIAASRQQHAATESDSFCTKLFHQREMWEKIMQALI